jgi:putative NADH-flavin reductase
VKIAVLAAAGRSGQAFVLAAIAAGHQVRAGIRGTDPFSEHPSLEVVHCDATNLHDVRTLLAGCDAVVSLIGHVQGSAPRVQTVAIDIIITVMEELRISRLVSLTGTGVRYEGDQVGLIDRFANWSIGMVDPERIADGKEHVALIEASDLDWTIVRVLKLQNIAAKPYVLTEHGPTKLVVGRTEVAQAILEVLIQRSFIKKAPMLSKRSH